MDLIVIVVLILIGFFLLKKRKKIIYFVVLIDIVLRMLDYVDNYLNFEIDTPSTLPSLIMSRIPNPLNEIVVFVYALVVVLFIIELIKELI